MAFAKAFDVGRQLKVYHLEFDSLPLLDARPDACVQEPRSSAYEGRCR